MDDAGFRAEYAKSDRSTCKGCRTTINKDALRLAIMVQSPNFDGKVSYLNFFVSKLEDPSTFRFQHGIICHVFSRKSNQLMHK